MIENIIDKYHKLVINDQIFTLPNPYNLPEGFTITLVADNIVKVSVDGVLKGSWKIDSINIKKNKSLSWNERRKLLVKDKY